MIDLYFAPTANGLRAAIALEETDLPYTLHPVDLYKGEQHTPEFRRINPAGLIPVIVDADGPGGSPLTLNQSVAILIYCAEKTGRYIPAAPAARTLAMQWVMQLASDISGASMTVFRLENTAPEKSAANVEYFMKRLRDAYRVCEQGLEGKRYLAGEFSIADLALYPSFAMRRPMLEQDGGYPNLLRWGDELAERPAIMRAMRHAS